jgi:choline dehydrogenase-like flavoprotein
MLGGCSSINAEVYHRGPASDYDRWEELTNDPSWSYDALLPLFKKSEGFQTPIRGGAEFAVEPSDKYHGRSGEWKVSYTSFFHKISTTFVRAAEAVGLPFNPDFNAESTLGVGRVQTFVDNKCERSSAEKAFLDADVLRRPNLTVLTETTCLRLVIEDGTCRGAVILHDRQETTVSARKQVVVSCGAFDSPRILSASGISLPGLGKNLHDHLGINVTYKLPATADPSLETIDQWNGKLNQILALIRYKRFKDGPAASNIGEAAAFYRSELPQVLSDDASSGNAAPHVEVIAVPVLWQHHEGQATPSQNRIRLDFDWSEFELTGRYITIIPVLLNPYSRGEVRFDEHKMEIDPNYLADQRDIDVLVEGIKMVRKIVQEGYPQELGLEELFPGPHVKSDATLGAYVRQYSETIYHPVGTCKVRLNRGHSHRWVRKRTRWRLYLRNWRSSGSRICAWRTRA